MPSNLTTIDFAHAVTDVQRILDSVTEPFYDWATHRYQSARRRRIVIGPAALAGEHNF